MPAQWQYDYQQQWTLHQPKCAHLPSQPVQDIFPSSSSIYNIYPVKIPQCKYGQEVQVKQAQRQWEWTWSATEGTEAVWEQLWFRLALGHWTPDNGAQPNSSLAQAHKATPGSDHLPSLCLYLVPCAVHGFTVLQSGSETNRPLWWLLSFLKIHPDKAVQQVVLTQLSVVLLNVFFHQCLLSPHATLINLIASLISFHSKPVPLIKVP